MEEKLFQQSKFFSNDLGWEVGVDSPAVQYLILPIIYSSRGYFIEVSWAFAFPGEGMNSSEQPIQIWAN